MYFFDCRTLTLAINHSLLHAQSLQLQILPVCLSVCLSALFIATPTDRCAFYLGVGCNHSHVIRHGFGAKPALKPSCPVKPA